ncbi:hypothetical protein BT93_G1392 [Corymbia citriodora subsp. variegata]|nr:hypothetical protein BT93_G1392 [Corymbia citriodora subsp. variegata]
MKSASPRHAMSSTLLQPISAALFLLLIAVVAPTRCQARSDPDPAPAPAATPWPPQFHAALFMNNSGALQLVDLWYDLPSGRNLNAIRDQLSASVLYDVEWDNGTSYYYTLSDGGGCRTLHFSVGILRPNWLDGATYLGRSRVDGFECDGWMKVDFIRYYEDVATKRPVHWTFSNGMTAHVMTYEVGAVLEDAKWQAPAYCFGEEEGADGPKLAAATGVSRRFPVDGLGALGRSMSL